MEEQLSAVDALRAAIEQAQRRPGSLRRAVVARIRAARDAAASPG